MAGFNAGRVEVHLGAQLDKRDFDLYEKKLKEVRTQVAKKEQFKAQLGGDFHPRAFNAYQRELKQTNTAMDETNRRTRLLGGHTQTLAGHMKRAAGAALAAGSAYAGIAAAKSSITITEDLAKTTLSLHKNLGLSIKSASEWAAVAKARGVEGTKLAQTFTILAKNVEAGAVGFDNLNAKSSDLKSQMDELGHSTADQAKLQVLQERLHKAVAKGAGAQADAFKRLGVSEEQLKQGDFNDVLSTVSDGLAKMHAGTEKAALQARLFGRGWQAVVPILRDGSKAMNEQLALAEKYGVTFEGKTVKSIKDLIAAQREAKFATMGLQVAFGLQLAPVMTKVITTVNQFVLGMREGTGAGGRFAAKLGAVGNAIGNVIGFFRRNHAALEALKVAIGAAASAWVAYRVAALAAAAANPVTAIFALIAALGTLYVTNQKVRKAMNNLADVFLGFFSTVIDGERAVARLIGALIPGNDKFDKFADRAQIASDKLNDLRKQLRRSTSEFGGLENALDNMNDHLADGRGVKRFSGNLRSARNAARTNITGAVGDVHQGLDDIRSALSRNLKDLGVSGELKPIGGLKLHGVGTPLNKAGGGWIGQRGMRGQDTVPAMLAPGEAVLNRHQQTIIEALLGDGFLDQLFARIDTPHYFARGGLMGANPGLGPYAALGSRYGLSVTSGRRPGSITSSGNVSLHSSGNAIDVNAGSPGSMLSYAKAMASRFGSGLDELIHTPLGFGIKNGRRVAPYAVADHYDHVHVGDRTPGGAGGGFAEKITAPRVGGSGALRAIVQGSLNLSAQGATKQLQNLVGSMGISSDFGTGGAKIAGGQYGKAQLSALWRGAGGPSNLANLAAAIALAESGGNPTAHNPSGASGLWQILGQVVRGNIFNPMVNARNAVSKWRSAHGFSPWVAYTNGSYHQYLAKGGRVGSKRKKISVDTLVPAGRRSLPSLKALQKDRIPEYDTYISTVDDLNTGYGLREREYDLSVEELVNDDGSINERAIKKRGDELAGLASIRQRIIEQLVAARALARRIVKTYNTIIKRLRKSLAHAKKKDRSGIRGTISTYGERRDEWADKLHELQTSTLPSARLDLRELKSERREVLGTKATTDTGADTGGEADTGGGDTGGGDISTPDTTTAPPSAADIAAGAAQEFATYLAGAQDLFRSFGGNFTRGGGISGAPDVATALAGVRGFGAGGGLGGVSGAPVIVVQQGGSFAQFASAPDDAPTFVSQVRFQVESAAG
jgi:hypothetical protein